MDKETFKYFPPVIDRDAQGRITLHLCDDDYMRFIDMVNYFDYFRPRIFGPPTDFSTEIAKQEVPEEYRNRMSPNDQLYRLVEALLSGMQNFSMYGNDDFKKQYEF